MVDALYNQLVQKPLRQGGFAPKLSDCELICMEIVGEFLGMDTDKKNLAIFQTTLAKLVSQFRLLP